MSYLSPQELKELTKPNGIRAALAVSWDWALIGLGFYLAIRFPSPLVYALSFILIARQQLALAILMHDGAHRRLFANSRWSDFVGQHFCASPLFFSMESYQRLHLKHHQNPLAPDDPDLTLIGGFPISRKSFLRKLFRDATGISYFKFIRYFVYMARQPKVERKAGPVVKRSKSLSTLFLSMILINGVLFATLLILHHGWLYLALWLLPTMTALQILLRIRGIAEHAGYHQNPDQRMNARTVINRVQTYIFAPHNVNYHIEHHIYPAVPYFNLPKLHKIFVERAILPKENVYPGYGTILRELVHSN